MGVHVETRRAPGPTVARAGVVLAPERVALRDVPMPQPGPREVRVGVEGSGVCASSGPIWEGRPWFEYPLDPGAPGHEGWGRVDAVGAEVSDVFPGDRVAMLSYRAHASHDVAAADALVRLPPELEGVPVPGEPLGCAMNVFARSGIGPGQTVAVVGVGFLGALLIQLAASVGARVLAVSRRPFALRVAARCGAQEAIAFDGVDEVAARVHALTGGSGCDRVVEAVGHQDALTLAGRLASVRGRLVIAGFHQDGLRQVDMQHWNWQGLDVINAHERDPRLYVEGMRQGIEAVASGRLDPMPLYTHVVRLPELSRAYRLLRERPEGFLKALVLA
jgi:threonine dehydrogenase-like Zn-dependent dehydrogenase